MLKRKIALNTPLWLLIGSSKDPDFDPTDPRKWDEVFESGRGLKTVYLKEDQEIVNKTQTRSMVSVVHRYSDLIFYLYRKEYLDRRGFHVDKIHFDKWVDTLEKTAKEFRKNFKYATVND